MTTPDKLSLWDLTMDGGYLMIPLALLLLVSIYVFIERCIVLNKALKMDPTFMQRIREYIKNGDIDNATNLCKRADTAVSRMLLKGVERIGRPVQDVLAAIENQGNLESAGMGRGMTWLSTTAAGAPMLGFLGTVTGMIEAFFALAKSGTAANITVLSSGIYQALVTTVAGLVVGILAMFAYNYLTTRLNRIINLMEARTMDFMDLLNEPAGIGSPGRKTPKF